MGDIIKKEPKKNKFDEAVEVLNNHEEKAFEKSEKVIKKITGKAEKKKSEERKVLPTYIPMSMYEKFNEINEAYGISNNAAINMLIRQYVMEKQGVLDTL